MNNNRINRTLSFFAACLLPFAATAAETTVDEGDARSSAIIGDALMQAARAKLAVSEQVLTSDRWPGSNAEAGFKPEESSNYAVDIGENGAVTVHFAAAAGEALAGHELRLIPSRSAAEQGIVKWQCWSHGLAEQIIPEGCESQP